MDSIYPEYVEFALDMLRFFTYFPVVLSSLLWVAFPLLYDAFENWAFYYINANDPITEHL